MAAVDLTARLSQGWRPPSCVAQELLLRCLLDDVEEAIDRHGTTDINPYWRSGLEDGLFEDPAHEMLYNPSLSAFEKTADFPGHPDRAAMAFEWWFVPFTTSGRLPPYAEDEPPTEPR